MSTNIGSIQAIPFGIPLGLNASTYGSYGTTAVVQYDIVNDERILYMFFADTYGGDADGRLLKWNVEQGTLDAVAGSTTANLAYSHPYGPACGIAKSIDGEDWWYIAGGYHTTNGNRIERICISDPSKPSEDTGDLISATAANNSVFGFTYNGYLYKLGATNAKYLYSTGARTDLTLPTNLAVGNSWVLDQNNDRVFYFTTSEELRYYDFSTETSTLVRSALPDYFATMGLTHTFGRGTMIEGDSFTLIPNGTIAPTTYSSLFIDLDTDQRDHKGWFLDEINGSFVGLSEAAICKHSNGLYYIFGGKTSTETSGTDDIWEFDPATETLTLYSAKLPENLHSGTLVEDTDSGHLYYFGGNGSSSSELHCLEYNVSTHTITAQNDMPEGCEYPPVMYHPTDDKFYVILPGDLYSFTPGTDTWSSSLGSTSTATYDYPSTGRMPWITLGEDYIIYKPSAATLPQSVSISAETITALTGGDNIDPDETFFGFSRPGWDGMILVDSDSSHIRFIHQNNATSDQDNCNWENIIESVGTDTGLIYDNTQQRLLMLGGDLIVSNMLVKYDITNDKFSIPVVGPIPHGHDIGDSTYVISMDGWAIIPWISYTQGASDGSYSGSVDQYGWMLPYEFETFSGNVKDSDGSNATDTDVFAIPPWILKLFFPKVVTDGSGNYTLQAPGDSSHGTYSEKPTIAAIPKTGQGAIRTNADINQGA